MGILKNYEGVCGDFFDFLKISEKFTFPIEYGTTSDGNRHRRESESAH